LFFDRDAEVVIAKGIAFTALEGNGLAANEKK
jgi:hypothetical protein